MPRRTLIAAATAALAALLVIGPVHASVREPRVVVVLAPYLTWEDVMSGPMPAIRSLADRGVVGNVNVRSSTPGAGAPSISRGAIMLSAGASGLSDAQAEEGYSADETVGPVAASDMYEVLYGRSSGTSRVLYLGSARQANSNAKTTSDTRVGALGQIMHDAGVLTAAIGNSDKGLDTDLPGHIRPAAIIAADEMGLVDLGNVSTSLLAVDPKAPFGVRTDQPAIEREYRAAVQAGARFIVIDPGDLARAYVASSSSTTEAAAVTRSNALRATDNIVGMVDRTLSEQDMLVVFAPVAPESVGQPHGFAPVVLRGPLDEFGGSRTGLARTPSTRRDGLCTVMDLSSTLVGVMGQKTMPQMVGRPISGSGDDDAARLIAMLDRTNRGLVAVETSRMPFINWYIVFSIIVLVASAVLLDTRAREYPSRLRSVVRAMLLLSVAFAPAGLLMLLVIPWPQTPLAAVGALLVTVVVIWVPLLIVSRRRPAGFAMMLVTGFTTLVLVADQLAGAPLSFGSFFGYAPLFGARYYGIGNEMAGALLGCSLVCAALVLDLYRDRPWVNAARRFGWPAVAAVVTFVTVAPFLGANIAAIAWMTAAFLAGAMLLAGRKVLTWRNAIVAAVVIVVLLAGAIAVDIVGSDGGSHLGRLVTETGESGIDAFVTIVVRKAETNLRIFGRTNWTWLLLSMIAILGYMRWRPSGEFGETLARYPALAAAMTAGLIGGVVGYFTEDSGIIIPALALLPLGIAVLDLMLARAGEGDGG